jgi:hypothetical protein
MCQGAGQWRDTDHFARKNTKRPQDASRRGPVCRGAGRGLFDCEQWLAIVDAALRFLLLRAALTRMEWIIPRISIWPKECNETDAFL